MHYDLGPSPCPARRAISTKARNYQAIVLAAGSLRGRRRRRHRPQKGESFYSEFYRRGTCKGPGRGVGVFYASAAAPRALRRAVLNTASRSQSHDERHQEHQQEDKEQDLGDSSRCTGDSAEPQQRGDQRNDQKCYGPTQHICLLSLQERATACSKHCRRDVRWLDNLGQKTLQGT